MSQKTVQSQYVKLMPDNITLRIGETYENRDHALFLIFNGVTRTSYMNENDEEISITIGRIQTLITSNSFGPYQPCILFFQETHSIFLEKFEYKVNTLNEDSVFLVKQ